MNESSTRQVVIIAMQGSWAGSIGLVKDLLCVAGMLWQPKYQNGLHPYFNIDIASVDGKPVSCFHNTPVVADKALAEVEKADLVIVPAIWGNPEQMVLDNAAVINWLREQHEAGAVVVCATSGTYLAAEAGLLDGKLATTHWAFAHHFEQRYPAVNLHIERLITDAGRLYCTGGINAVMDVVIHIIEQFCGQEVARQTARYCLAGVDRTYKGRFVRFDGQKAHQDEAIMKIQVWLEENLATKKTFQDIAQMFSLSLRTLKRRFKNATGETPLQYLQRLRVEKARQMLESSHRTVQEIAYEVGYDYSGSFCKVFKQHTNLQPNEYRKQAQFMNIRRMEH